MSELPQPQCRYGYTTKQVEEIVGDRAPEFWRDLRGQTIACCTGSEYDYGTEQERETGCGPHGTAVYGDDLRRFLAGCRPAGSPSGSRPIGTAAPRR